MTDNVNSQMMNDLKELMGDEFSVLLETYISDADSRLKNLHFAMTNNDASQVRELAHALKGSSANLGANKLSELCFELENIGRDSRLDDAPEKLGEIEAEYQPVKDYFKSLL